MSKKRIIIIGGGLLQVPAIQTAQEMGLYTIVVDYNKEAYGMKIADHPLIVSTRDVEGNVRAARALSKQMKIDGVITVGTDASMTVAAVANALGLPGNRFEDACAATNKIRMRERFKEHNVSQPNFFPAWSYDEAKEAFRHLNSPVVVKPADNMGSRGVMKILNESDMLNGFNRAKSASPSGEVIIEEYMDGPELSIDMLIYGDEIFVTGVADRIIEYPPYFVETGHIMPSILPEEQIEDAVKVMKDGIRALGLKIGAAKGDIKVTKHGAMVGEIAARLSGGFMSAYTYPFATGVNLIKNAIEIALGSPPSDLTPKWSKVAVEKAFIPGAGIINSIEGVEKAKKIKGVKEIFIKIKQGELLLTPTNNLEKAGNVITVADTRDEAIEIANKAIETVHFNITNENEITKEEIKRAAWELLASKPEAHYLFDENTYSESGLNKYLFNPNFIRDDREVNIETTMFDRHISQPIILDNIYNLENIIKGKIDLKDYYENMLEASSNCEVLAILNDFGTDEGFKIAVKSIKESQRGIVMLSSLNSNEVLIKRFKEAEDSGAIAVGLDLTQGYNTTKDLHKSSYSYAKSEKELSVLVKSVKTPFILKGVVNPLDIQSAVYAGVNTVYISNSTKYILKHIGKIADILECILSYLKQSHKSQISVIVESGRHGMDTLMYLMLGASAVCITNDIFVAGIGKGRKGIEYIVHKNKEEMINIMSYIGLNGFKDKKNTLIYKSGE